MNLPWRSMTVEERLHWVIDHWRRTVPFLFVLTAGVAMTIPLTETLPLVPHFAFLAVYVWVQFQPSLLPAWLGFPLGLAVDLLTGMPLGVNAALLPALALILRHIPPNMRPRHYLFDWLLVLPFAMLYLVLAMHLAGFAGVVTPFGPLVLQAALTAIAYPVIAWACARVQRNWVDD